MTPQERKVMELALEALEKVTKEMLALKDELAERGGRPTTDSYRQKLWDSAFDAYTGHALPAAAAIKEALAVDKESLTTEAQQEDLYDLAVKADNGGQP